jgi:hypothetical protein
MLMHIAYDSLRTVVNVDMFHANVLISAVAKDQVQSGDLSLLFSLLFRRFALAAVSMYAAGNLNNAGLPGVRSAARVHGFALPTSSAISTMSDANSPPATDFVQPVSQSRVLAGRSRSIVIPPRMFGQARGRGSHLPVSDPRPTRSAMVCSSPIELIRLHSCAVV